jgi:methylornithine synthase
MARRTKLSVTSILDKARQGILFDASDISFVLGLRQPKEIESLFTAARFMRQQHFGEDIFLYGFLYTSTLCRNNCHFCYYRADNTLPPRYRYRKKESDILEASIQLAESGVHLIDLTMGEDPQCYKDEVHGFDPIIQITQTIKEVVKLPIMISPGVVPEDVLERLAAAGADWFACYQETHNLKHFNHLRPKQNYNLRLQTKFQAHQFNMLIEEGILVGVGETATDISNSFEAMLSLEADQVRAMNFVPQAGTPMAGYPVPDPMKELLLIALMRLSFPSKLIPATLDVEGLAGLKHRLDAGANVVTSIVPPSQGLLGVAQSSLDIDEARRTVKNVTSVLERCQLNIASQHQFETWIQNRKKGHVK